MSDVKPLAGKRPLVIAHRGASATTPENTLTAFKMAVDVGADVLELDVRLTRDCQVVVCHDDTVNRTTDNVGMVAEMDYERLRWLDAGYRFTMDKGLTFPFRQRGVGIPLLAEVLRIFPHVPLIVELKDRDKTIVPATLAVLRRHGRLSDGSVLVTSFNHSHLKELRRLAPESFSGCSRLENARLLLASALHARWLFGKRRQSFQLPMRKARLPITTPKVVATAHKLGMEVYAYTVNDWHDMRRYLDMGVDGIITDRPHRLRIVTDNRD